MKMWVVTLVLAIVSWLCFAVATVTERKAYHDLEVDVHELLGDKVLSVLHTNVNWMGHPMFFEGDSTNGSFHWADDVELGCRADGVVVWKKIGIDTNQPTITIRQNVEEHPRKSLFGE